MRTHASEPKRVSHNCGDVVVKHQERDQVFEVLKFELKRVSQISDH